MTDEEKRKEIQWLYHQLDKCGQMIAEDDFCKEHKCRKCASAGGSPSSRRTLQ